MTGPRAGAVRLPEPVEAVSSDYHRALSAGGLLRRPTHRAKVIPGRRLSMPVLGETLPFGWRGPEGDPTAEGQSRGALAKPLEAIEKLLHAFPALDKQIRRKI